MYMFANVNGTDTGSNTAMQPRFIFNLISTVPKVFLPRSQPITSEHHYVNVSTLPSTTDPAPYLLRAQVAALVHNLVFSFVLAPPVALVSAYGPAPNSDSASVSASAPALNETLSLFLP